MKVYYEHWAFKYWPLKGYDAITILPNVILVAKSKHQIYQELMYHEMGHVLQYELLDPGIIDGPLDAIAVFWLTYGFSYLWNLAKYRSHWKAYKQIWHERLAREFARKEKDADTEEQG